MNILKDPLLSSYLLRKYELNPILVSSQHSQTYFGSILFIRYQIQDWSLNSFGNVEWFFRIILFIFE